MRDDEARRSETTAGSDPELPWIEEVVLFGIGFGASPVEIVRSPGNGEASPELDAIERAVTNLERHGLLQTVAGVSGTDSALTASGRRLLLVRLGQIAKAAATLEAERGQVERLRTDLLSTISHELRTPLTLIRTSIGLLLDSEPDEEMRLRLLRNIKQSTDRMNALVTDLLDLARLRQDRLDLNVRNVDLQALVSGVVSLMRPLLDAKGQRVDLVVPLPPPVVPGDFRRLERVLLNLLGNANKFAPAGTVISVTIRDGAEGVTIAVQDAGAGIAAEAMPHLFDQFFTDRTSSSRHNIGVGLGLPIAKGIVEAHGGRIWVESALGVGTTVSFTLPKIWPGEGYGESAGG
jgi:signal transduction histidine kinase